MKSIFGAFIENCKKDGVSFLVFFFGYFVTASVPSIFCFWAVFKIFKGDIQAHLVIPIILFLGGFIWLWFIVVKPLCNSLYHDKNKT